MPKIINKELLEYGSGYKLTKGAIDGLAKAISLSKENVFDENYELYNITKHLVTIMPHKSTRENRQLETTLEIMRAIEFLKDSNLIKHLC